MNYTEHSKQSEELELFAKEVSERVQQNDSLKSKTHPCYQALCPNCNKVLCNTSQTMGDLYSV